MTLHNHLLLNTIPLSAHHPILFLNSQNNLSQNRRHFAQNLSHAEAEGEKYVSSGTLRCELERASKVTSLEA